MSDRLVCRCGVIGALRVLIILFAVCCLGLQIGLFVVAGGVAAAHPHADALHWLYVIDGALMVGLLRDRADSVVAIADPRQAARCVFRRGGALDERYSCVCRSRGRIGGPADAVSDLDVAFDVVGRCIGRRTGSGAIRHIGRRSGFLAADYRVRAADAGNALIADAGHRTA